MMVGYLRFWLSLFLCTHLLATVMLLGALIWVKIGRAEAPPVSLPNPETAPTPSPAGAGPVLPPPPTASSSPEVPGQFKLIIPVAAVRASDLRDTFNEARSQERQHHAIDIMAPRGTAVLAAAGGEIVKLYSSDL